MIFTRDKSFYKNLITLAIPISLQGLLTFLVGFADNLMVSSLGDEVVSGVYLGNKIISIYQLLIMGIEGSLLILSSQYWGKRDTASIKKIISVALKVAILISILFTLASTLFPTKILSLFTEDEDVVLFASQYLQIIGFSYIFYAITHIFIFSMRSIEVAGIGFVVSFTTLIVDIGLNYLLIFGINGLFPAMGVRGAATATLIARIVECIIMIWYVFRVDKVLHIKAADLLLHDKRIALDFFKYGAPIIGGNLIWAVNGFGQSAILGRFNAEVLAAVSITDTLNNLAYVWMTGLSSAVSIITAKTVGSGRIDKIKEYSRTVEVIFLALGFITGLIIYLVRTPFVGLYGVSDAAAAQATQLIVVLAITLIGTCYQAACLAGLVKAGGDIAFVFKNDIIFVFLVVLPAGFISWKLGAPPWVVFACLKCDQILKCFVAVIKINSFNWIKNLTR